ncbi:NYN domain-containing protein [Homoserinibacter sp. GY 40078]|uniref:NYN domain-containing protein n=1 Tax=Homoserinibacter sp. GY 40078 TaxID=2603275 RepID=UPI0011CA38A1|nr:NYN domain-containing protein [Homoserinibacter sp. GY 40078]TXK17094.1 NYN domain-containing protein [Homoserinibacter sp. GY 40078]
MPDSVDAERVAVYIDFDNIVISRYDQIHGSGAWRKDNARDARKAVAEKLDAARIDVTSLLDYASKFGTVAVSRAYADWSVPANASYRGQLVDRAIDLTQMFPASGTKNGADIRLSVDVLEDLFRLPDITHVMIVAGDSDYIPLAQRSKRLGRVVVGVGVRGGTSQALIAACDDFAYYDDIAADEEDAEERATSDDALVDVLVADDAPDAAPAATAPDAATAVAQPGQRIGGPGASKLLIKALGLVTKDDDGWALAGVVKSQMKRLNPEFSEKSLGHANFTEFVKKRSGQVELREDGQQRYLRLRPQKKKQTA